VAHVTEHHTKEEGEGYERDDDWVCFLVGWYTICINNQLPDMREFSSSEHGWWYDSCVLYFSDLARLWRI